MLLWFPPLSAPIVADQGRADGSDPARYHPPHNGHITAPDRRAIRGRGLNFASDFCQWVASWVCFFRRSSKMLCPANMTSVMNAPTNDT